MTRAIEINDKDLEKIIKFTKLLKNDRICKQKLAEALFNLGLNKRKKGVQKYEEAINYFKESIDVKNN